MPVEDRNGEIGFAPFGNFTTSVRFNRIEQNSEEVRPAAAHLVEDRGGRYQVRQAARFRSPQTQQPHDITRVSVVGLAFTGLVNPRIGIEARAPKILNVPKQVAIGVLHSQLAKVGADSEKRNCRFAFGPTLDWQGLDQHEAAAAEHLFQ